MSFPKYEKYKGSKVEWLGEVPAHWEIKRFKYIFCEREERSTNGSETLLSVSAYTGVTPRSEVIDDGDFLSRAESLEGYKVCYVNDLVINIMLAWNRGLAVTKYEGIVSPAYCVFSIIDESDPRFLNYLVRTDEYTLYFKAFSSGVIDSRLRIYPDTFGRLFCGIPAFSEQIQIAEFLDRETEKIDELVAEQQRLIDFLKEKRQAVISHAVTRGLNPNVKLKPSGIKWLGDIPVHWKVSAIKRYTDKITDGAHISPETENGVFHFVSTKDVGIDCIDFDNCLLTSEKSFEYLVKNGCRPLAGDVLFSKDGTIGRTVVIRENHNFVVASSLIIIRPTANILDSDFLNYLCQSQGITNQVECFVKGAGLPRLSIQNLAKIIGCFPPLEEQKIITAFLKFELTKFDTLITEAKRIIILLQERRTALISAAVTGKIDVRQLNKN